MISDNHWSPYPKNALGLAVPNLTVDSVILDNAGYNGEHYANRYWENVNFLVANV